MGFIFVDIDRNCAWRFYRDACRWRVILSWLSYGQAFGLQNPVVLNLGVMSITFGLSIEINIASILGMILSIIIYRFL